jgi:opacity protein-like surface antigen
MAMSGIARAAGAVAALIVPLLAGTPVAAQDESSDWSGSLTIYGWLTGATGDVSARDRDLQADISASLSDILEDLEFAAFATGEVRRDRLGLILDVVYSSLSQDGTASGPFATDTSTDLKMLLLTSAVAARVYGTDERYVDALAGARYVSTNVDVSTRREQPVPASRSASQDVDWVDPLIGVRAGLNLTEKIAVRGLADVGGFGAGSKLSWEAFVGGNYAFTKHVLGEVGFRYLHIDYEGDKANLDLNILGPTIGVTFQF